MGMKTAMQILRDTIEASQDEFVTSKSILIWIDTWGLEKEKQQIIDAYDNGRIDFVKYDPERHGNESPKAEQYYNSTFKQD